MSVELEDLFGDIESAISLERVCSADVPGQFVVLDMVHHAVMGLVHSRGDAEEGADHKRNLFVHQLRQKAHFGVE